MERQDFLTDLRIAAKKKCELDYFFIFFFPSPDVSLKGKESTYKKVFYIVVFHFIILMLTRTFKVKQDDLLKTAHLIKEKD